MGARSAFVKVNSDPKERAAFIKDPVAYLKSEGIQLNAKDQAELLAVIKTVKANLHELGELPAGHKSLIDAVDMQSKTRKEGDPGPMII